LIKESVIMLETISDSDLQNFVKLLEIAGILKRIQRTGWIEVGVYQPESVADHTFRTALLCMLYADLEKIDTLKLLRMALIHDLPEALVGDLTPKQKTEDTPQSEKNAIFKILNLLPKLHRETFLAVWNEYQEGKTKEAKAVQQLDKIEMALQAKEYDKLGISSKSLTGFIKSSKEAISWPDLKRLLSCILEET
jgi:putative hydrolase of HD superfamily